ncbi:MAG: stage III sporulation protein AA [Clostridia bacterium]|nr:stage III sporulation protein AA [Clostridia bacterium]
MYVLSDKQLNPPSYLSYMPPNLKSKLLSIPQEDLLEIRLRRQKPVILHYTHGRYYLGQDCTITTSRERALIATNQDISHALETAFEFSLYAHEDELSEGFITIKGGHRIGVCGEYRFGKFRNLTDITSLNYRIAHEHIGMSDAVKQDIVGANTIKNTLIISRPMCGKTSLIRDLARAISYDGFKVGVCDTRSEISAVYDGTPYMDTGDADIISGTSKADGIGILLRTMSPDVIICDEIGTNEDITTINNALGCGCAIIATAHSASRDDLLKHPSLSEVVPRFNVIITLEGIGKIKEVYYA